MDADLRYFDPEQGFEIGRRDLRNRRSHPPAGPLRPTQRGSEQGRWLGSSRLAPDESPNFLIYFPLSPRWGATGADAVISAHPQTGRELQRAFVEKGYGATLRIASGFGKEAVRRVESLLNRDE